MASVGGVSFASVDRGGKEKATEKAMEGKAG